MSPPAPRDRTSHTIKMSDARATMSNSRRPNLTFVATISMPRARMNSTTAASACRPDSIFVIRTYRPGCPGVAHISTPTESKRPSCLGLHSSADHHVSRERMRSVGRSRRRRNRRSPRRSPSGCSSHRGLRPRLESAGQRSGMPRGRCKAEGSNLLRLRYIGSYRKRALGEFPRRCSLYRPNDMTACRRYDRDAL